MRLVLLLERTDRPYSHMQQPYVGHPQAKSLCDLLSSKETNLKLSFSKSLSCTNLKSGILYGVPKALNNFGTRF